MNKFKLAMVFTTILGTFGASAVPILFSGHYYERIDHPERITWLDAKTEAAGMSYLSLAGHLVTISSKSENDFVFSFSSLGSTEAFWLGGFQPTGSLEPAGGWSWITGESFSYENWTSGEPNNQNGNEAAIEMPIPSGGTWNDQDPLGRGRSYIVEFEAVPDTKSTGGLLAGSLFCLAAARRYTRKKETSAPTIGQKFAP